MYMKALRRIGILLIFIITGVFFYFNSQWMFKNPNEKIQLNSVVKSDMDDKKNLYVLNESGSELVKINNNDQIVFSESLEEYGAAKDIIVIGESIYIRTVDVEKSGYRVAGDKIIMYSTNGKYLKTVYENVYDTPQVVTDIMGLYSVDNQFMYIKSQNDNFTLYDENSEIVKKYELDESNRILNSIAISREGKDTYYCRLNGKIYKYVDGVNDLLLYDAADAGELSIPRSLTIDEDRNLYFSDIARREVFCLNESGDVELVQEYEEGTDFYEKDICYYVEGNNGLKSGSGYVVKIYDEEEIRYVWQVTYMAKIKLLCVIGWICVAVDSIIAIYIFVKLSVLAKKRMSKYGKMALIAVGVVGAIALVFTGIVMPPFKSLLLNQMFNQAQVLSESAVYVLDKEAIKEINSPDDYDGEAYAIVRESMNNLFLSGSESTSDFYVQIYTIQQENIITVTYCLQEDTGAVYPYDWAFEGSDEEMILNSKTGKTYSSTKSSEGSYLFVLNPILDDEGNAIGLIEVGTDLSNFQNEYMNLLWNLLINIAAITVVVVLIIIEVLAFLEGREEYIKRKHEDKYVILPNGLLRVLVFIIFFVTNLSTGFLPNYAMKISSDNQVIPKEILAAIPISAEVIVGAIFSIWGTYVIKKLGEKRATFISSVGIVAGFALRLIPNIWVLTIGNALIGAGWGILLLIVNTMIALKDEEEEKDSGFADYSAAALNGVNCGVVFGGLLTNWFSYRLIFVFSAVISLTILFYSKKYLSKEILRHAEDRQEKSKEKQEISFVRFIFNGKILSYFVMIVIPIIACGYFLNYMFPILGSEYGLSDVNISYGYLLNGICVICLSGVLTRLFSNKVDKRLSLIISVLLYAVAFLTVAHFQNIYSILAALILLGISDSFGLPIQTGYYTDLEIVKKYGYDKAIGIYSLFENSAQAAGSFVFSFVLIFGVSTGLNIVTGVIVILSFIFLLISMIGKNKKQ